MNFFRKYQRPILFTAVLFALFTFSITGDMLAVFGNMFQKQPPAASMMLGDREVKLTPEDRRVGRDVSNLMRTGFPVMPNLSQQGDESSEAERFAALRRQAIEAGIEASYADVDTAIDAMASARGLDDSRALASRFTSFGAFRTSIYEAMRIGTLVRSQSLAAMPFDHELVERALKDREVITLRVASLEKEAIEEGFEKELDAKGEEGAEAFLVEWLGGLEEDDLVRRQFTGQNKLKLDLIAAKFDAFDASQFTAELEGEEFGDAEVMQFYEANKTFFFRTPVEEKDDEKDGDEKDGDEKDGDKEDGDDEAGDEKESDKKDDDENGDDEKTPEDAESPQDDESKDAEGEGEQDPKPPEFIELDDALKASITKRLQSKEVLRKMLASAEADRFAALEPVMLARNTALEAKRVKETARDEAKTASEADEDNAELSAALEAAEQELEVAEAALKTTEEAVDSARESYGPLAGKLMAKLQGKAGFEMITASEKAVPMNELADLESIGTWPTSWQLRGLETAGQVGSQVQDAAKVSFLASVAEIETKPLIEFEEDDQKERLRSAYLTKLTDEESDKRKEAFEESLESLAREQRTEEVAKIEADQATKLDEELATWRSDLEESISETQKNLESAGIGERAKRRYTARLSELQGQLLKETEQREAIESRLKLETETLVDEDLRNAYGAVLAQAAEAGQFTVETVGPALRDPRTRGPVTHLPKAVQFFLYGSHTEDLEEVGDATAVLDDATGRAFRVAVCEAIAPATVDNLTRRDILEVINTNARSNQLAMAALQSYSMDSLEKRIGFRRPGEEGEITPGDPEK